MEPADPAGPMVLLTRLSRLVYRSATEERLGMRLKAFATLSYLRAFEGEQQGELCGHMHMDRNNMVLLLNELEERGWVRRERDPEDRRRHLVYMTADGLDALTQAEARIEEQADDVIGALDAGERETLRDLLARALAAHRAAAAQRSTSVGAEL